MMQKPKRYVTKQLHYCYPDAFFYKNIEEMCNKMLEKGYILEQTIVVVVNDVNENKVILIFAEY